MPRNLIKQVPALVAGLAGVVAPIVATLLWLDSRYAMAEEVQRDAQAMILQMEKRYIDLKITSNVRERKYLMEFGKVHPLDTFQQMRIQDLGQEYLILQKDKVELDRMAVMK